MINNLDWTILSISFIFVISTYALDKQAGGMVLMVAIAMFAVYKVLMVMMGCECGVSCCTTLKKAVRTKIAKKTVKKSKSKRR